MSAAREFPRPDAGDFSAIVALLGATGLPSADLSLPALVHFRVARDGDQIIAVAGVQPVGQVGLLRSVAVAAAYRGRGYASRLVAALEAEARRLGLEALYLLTDGADVWFARRGYAILPRDDAPAAVRDTAEFRQLCPDTAVCMRKDLARAARPAPGNPL